MVIMAHIVTFHAPQNVQVVTVSNRMVHALVRQASMVRNASFIVVIVKENAYRAVESAALLAFQDYLVQTVLRLACQHVVMENVTA